MAGAGVRLDLEYDDSAAGRALMRLVREMADPRPVFDEIGGRLVTSVQHRFERGQGPSGAAWPISGRARRESGQTLVMTGRLLGSIAHNASRDGVEVGTNVGYAAIHQFGGRTKPRTIRARQKKALFWPGARHPVKQVRHPGSAIPARPFLGLDSGDEAMIVDTVARRLSEAVA